MRAVGSIAIGTEAERDTVLFAWNDTARVYGGSNLVHRAVAEQAEVTPDAIAAVCHGQHVTYATLGRRARQLARWLRCAGVGPEVRVALLVDRSVDLMVAVLGVLEAGGVYVPLDPVYPPERLARLIEQTNAPVLMTQESLRNTLQVPWMPTLCLDRDWRQIEQAPAAAERPASPDNLAYVVYTSGSTGQPKGVGITHRSLCNLGRSIVDLLAIGPGTRVLQFASFSFDAAAWEWATTLIGGGTLVFADRQELVPGPLSAQLAEQAIDLVTLPPTAAAVTPVVPSLQTLILAGEACTANLAARWAVVSRVINAYGPTEVTVCATTSRPLDPRTAPPIGRPIGNARVYVLDGSGAPSAVGIAGELYVGGAGVARGYERQPALTAQCFVPDPFSPTPGARMYRTGDRVRWLPSGDLAFIGRVDRQLKFRGYRIEPGEIEAAACAHEGVAQAAVVARHDVGDEPRLVAYVVPRAATVGEAVTETTVRHYLQERLPEYMVPGAVVVMDRLPLTSNGKIDFKALPPPTRAATARGPAPRDHIEARLQSQWEAVLGVDRISIQADFFQAGGSSLDAVALSARLSSTFGEAVPVALIFEHPTIEKLARALRRGAVSSPWTPLVPLNSAGSRVPLFCVHPCGGMVHCYHDLAKALGPEQPFYGLQSRGLDREGEIRTSIESMAAAYIADLERVQPHGPYRLGGWSMGAFVAYEMARQLAAAGRAVATVAILDSTLNDPADALEGRPDLVSDAWQEAMTRVAIRDWIDLDPDRLPADADARAAVVLARAKAIGRVDHDLTVDQLRRMWAVYVANARAQACYRPGPYGGRVTLFRSALEQHAPADYGWGRVAPDLEIHHVHAPHAAFVSEPHAATIAGVLAAR